MKIYNKYFSTGYLRSISGLYSLMCVVMSFPVFFVSAASAASNDSIVRESTVSGKEFSAGLNADSLLQVFMVLVFIVLLIFALSIVLRKFNMLPAGSGKLIKIISGISLSSKDRLLLIQVGDEQLLISTSPGRINKIHTLAKPVELEENASTSSAAQKSFSGLLNSIIKREQP